MVTRWPWPHPSHPSPPSSLSLPPFCLFPAFFLSVFLPFLLSFLPFLPLSLPPSFLLSFPPSFFLSTLQLNSMDQFSTTREDQHPSQRWQTSHKNPTKDFRVGQWLTGRGLGTRRLRWGPACAATWGSPGVVAGLLGYPAFISLLHFPHLFTTYLSIISSTKDDLEGEV